MRVAEALAYALRAHGAREIFGIPGDFALPIFQVLEETEILPLYTMSHEPGVGFAADASARFRCEMGVALVTYGPGALNLVNSIAGAYAESSPVVVISGAPSLPETSGDLLLHHQAKTLDSQFRMYQEITCDQARLDDPVRAPVEIARVLRSCREQSLPVYIEIPRDIAVAECEVVEKLPPSRFDSSAVEECATEILERLRSAERPAILVGVEARRYRAEKKVEQLAKRLGFPVATTFMGRGLLAESEERVVGTYIGMAGKPEVCEFIEGSDGLFLLGVVFSDTNFGVSSRKLDMRRAVVASGRQVRISHHVYPDIPLDALLDSLLRLVDEESCRTESKPRSVVYPTGLEADGALVSPMDVACAVNDLMNKFGSMPIAADVGDCLFLAMDIEHTRLAAPAYYAGMGFGVPGGLGIQVATGERPLVLVGDGAFQMTGWELGNCQRYGWDPIVLLLNNASWEMLRVFSPDSKFNDLDDWHFAEIAASLGGIGERVTTRRELNDALERAVATRGKFVLIEVMLERGKISATLERFVETFKKKRDQRGEDG